MPIKKIAVINTSVELTDILRVALESENYDVGVLYTNDIKRRGENLGNFIEREKPEVIVYDIAIPYEENYKLFCKIKDKLEGKGIRFVLTTTNKRALEDLVGKTSAFEIIGKPFDLHALVKAVRANGVSKRKK